MPQSPGFGVPSKCQKRAGEGERDGNIRTHCIRQPREDTKGQQERDGGSSQEQPDQHETESAWEGQVGGHAETSIHPYRESPSGRESPGFGPLPSRHRIGVNPHRSDEEEDAGGEPPSGCGRRSCECSKDRDARVTSHGQREDDHDKKPGSPLVVERTKHAEPPSLHIGINGSLRSCRTARQLLQGRWTPASAWSGVYKSFV